MEFVDLGLSVKWANMAYGAKEEGGFGTEMDWFQTQKGELVDKKWKMPTKEQFEELNAKCKFESFLPSTNLENPSSPSVVMLIKATGPNGNSILFPYYSNGNIKDAFWTSTYEFSIDEKKDDSIDPTKAWYAKISLSGIALRTKQTTSTAMVWMVK